MTTISHLSSLRSSDFCRIVEKLSRSCEDQTRLTIEQVYPRICQLVTRASPCSGLDNWSPGELREFQDLILKYTRENILKINIYIKEPFAKKYIMVEYASMYVDLSEAQFSSNYDIAVSPGSVILEV